MVSKLRTTTRVAATTILCSILGAVLALAFKAEMAAAVPMFAAFGGFMTVVYQRDRTMPVEKKAE